MRLVLIHGVYFEVLCETIGYLTGFNLNEGPEFTTKCYHLSIRTVSRLEKGVNKIYFDN